MAAPLPPPAAPPITAPAPAEPPMIRRFRVACELTSAMVNPKFNVTSSTVAPNENDEDEENGEIEDVQGKVTAISAPTFTVDTGKSTVTFATDNSTQFKDGITKQIGRASCRERV